MIVACHIWWLNFSHTVSLSGFTHGPNTVNPMKSTWGCYNCYHSKCKALTHSTSITTVYCACVHCYVIIYRTIQLQLEERGQCLKFSKLAPFAAHIHLRAQCEMHPLHGENLLTFLASEVGWAADRNGVLLPVVKLCWLNWLLITDVLGRNGRGLGTNWRCIQGT